MDTIVSALHVIETEGPALGLNLNLAKCELFTPAVDNFDTRINYPGLGFVGFPDSLHLRSTTPNFVLLGSPFGDLDFCAQHVAKLRSANNRLLDLFPKLQDTQVALHLMRNCSSFSKLVYVARTTPPGLVHDSLRPCDDDTRACFSTVAVLQLTDVAWRQAQLSLSNGGVGLRSTARHCAAAYIASHMAALPGQRTATLDSALLMYADMTEVAGSLPDAQVEEWLEKAPSQNSLSVKLEKLDFDRILFSADATVTDRIRLTSVSASHSSGCKRCLAKAQST